MSFIILTVFPLVTVMLLRDDKYLTNQKAKILLIGASIVGMLIFAFTQDVRTTFTTLFWLSLVISVAVVAIITSTRVLSLTFAIVLSFSILGILFKIQHLQEGSAWMAYIILTIIIFKELIHDMGLKK